MNRVFSVGYIFPGGEVEYIPFESNRSLLDADIILFEPSLGDYYSSQNFQGKPWLGEDSSFQVKEQLSHWRSELREALGAGKLVVIFLAKPEDVFVNTGDKTFSGTGRNQKVTHLVEPASSYDAIPVAFERSVRTGDKISPVGALDFFASYWNEFGSHCRYEVTISGKFTRTLLRTRSGNAVVGALNLATRGAMVFLPPLHYDESAFTDYDDEGDEVWSEEAEKFGHRLLATLSALAKAVRRHGEETPPPTWSQDQRFRLPREEELQVLIRNCTEEIEKIQERRSELEQQLHKAGQLRALLYGRGKELEMAIVSALKLMGFDAAPYEDADSEFDIVFSSAEGRFLGEAEGKDRRSINIDKLSQLERNIQEDFAKDKVEAYAKGVLFGNAHRLAAPAERGDSFTPKCVSGAKRSQVALVCTADLFLPAKYLASQEDSAYAQACRRAIANTSGEIVGFPEPKEVPLRTKETNENVADARVELRDVRE